MGVLVTYNRRPEDLPKAIAATVPEYLPEAIMSYIEMDTGKYSKPDLEILLFRSWFDCSYKSRLIFNSFETDHTLPSNFYSIHRVPSRIYWLNTLQYRQSP